MIIRLRRLLRRFIAYQRQRRSSLQGMLIINHLSFDLPQKSDIIYKRPSPICPINECSRQAIIDRVGCDVFCKPILIDFAVPFKESNLKTKPFILHDQDTYPANLKSL